MTISVLQERETSSSASVSSVVLSFSSNVTASSAIHAAATDGGVSTLTYTFSDNNSGSYAAANRGYDSTHGQGIGHSVASNHAAGATQVTVTFSVSASFCGIWIREIGGAATSAADGHNEGAQHTVTSATLAATNTNQPALISAVAFDQTNGTPPTAAGGFTSGISGWDFGSVGVPNAESEHLRITTTGSQAENFTLAGSGDVDSLIQILDEASGVDVLLAQICL